MKFYKTRISFFFFVFILFFVIDIEESFGDGSQINGECINMNNSKSTVCDENFRNQSMKVFSVVDRSVGIFEDPNTKLTIVDLGSFYGIGGNGTIPDTIKVYRDDVLWKTTTKETGIAPSTSHSEWQIPQTFFYNELPGKYRLVSITNNTETLVFEFIVKQINKSEKNLLYLIESDIHNENHLEYSQMAPIKQIASGIMPKDIVCKEHLNLVFKSSNDDPVCVMPETTEKLIERSWANTR